MYFLTIICTFPTDGRGVQTAESKQLLFDLYILSAFTPQNWQTPSNQKIQYKTLLSMVVPRKDYLGTMWHWGNMKKKQEFIISVVFNWGSACDQ